MEYEGKMDKECVRLCDAVNIAKGIETTDSCCGHGTRPYRIWFAAKNLQCLPQLLYWFDSCHCGYCDWRIYVTTDCGMSPVHFCIKGPIGEKAYNQAKSIATQIRKYLIQKSSNDK